VRFAPERPRVQWLLYYAYELILTRRRVGLLERLGRHPLHLVVSGSGSLPPQHPASVVHGPTRFTEVLKMIDQSRAMIIVQPNHSHTLTERTLTAMHRGAVVLSTPNAFLDQHFVDGEDYIRIDPSWSDLAEKIAGLDDARRTDAISEAARRKVAKRFSPEASVARYLEVIAAARR